MSANKMAPSSWLDGLQTGEEPGAQHPQRKASDAVEEPGAVDEPEATGEGCSPTSPAEEPGAVEEPWASSQLSSGPGRVPIDEMDHPHLNPFDPEALVFCHDQKMWADRVKDAEEEKEVEGVTEEEEEEEVKEEEEVTPSGPKPVWATTPSSSRAVPTAAPSSSMAAPPPPPLPTGEKLNELKRKQDAGVPPEPEAEPAALPLLAPDSPPMWDWCQSHEQTSEHLYEYAAQMDHETTSP
jgi:hypothetical protein